MKFLIFILVIVTILQQIYCVNQLYQDDNSYANTGEVILSHVDLVWNLDLDNQKLDGTAILTLKSDIWNLQGTQDNCQLKTDLVFQKIDCIAVRTEGTQEYIGQQLKVTIDGGIPANKTFQLKVKYYIDNNQESDFDDEDISYAIQFIPQSLTPSLKFPAAFTHSHTVYSRTLFPTQDTPSIKITWDAIVKVTPNIGETNFFMPGEYLGLEDEADDHITYHYKQSVAMPAYTLAFICGDFVQYNIPGTSSKIIADQFTIDRAKFYLANYEMYQQFVLIYLGIESPLYANLLLVVPPVDYPYSTQENGNLIFISSSIIPKLEDKEKFNDLYHEVLARSIAQTYLETVAQSNWTASWLTDGISTFIGRQVIKQLFTYNYESVNLAGNQSYYNFISNAQLLEPTFASLAPLTSKWNPQRSINVVQREKANLFLEYLQTEVLTELEMIEFLRDWVNNTQGTFDRRSNEQFKTSLKKYFQTLAYPNEKLQKAGLDEWIYGLDLPQQKYEDALLKVWMIDSVKEILQMAEEFFSLRGVAIPYDFVQITQNWIPSQIVLFLSYFQDNLHTIKRTKDQYYIFQTMDKILGLQNHRSIEVKTTFIELALRTKYYKQVIVNLEQILGSTGNLDLILPLYETLMDVGQEQKAKEIYLKAKKYYHPIARQRIEDVLYDR